MPYVRLTIAKPRHGQEDALIAVMQKLADVALEQPDCIGAYVLRPHDTSGEIARITIYENEDAGDRMATTEHVLSLRSELNILAEPNHTERAFYSIEPEPIEPAKASS